MARRGVIGVAAGAGAVVAGAVALVTLGVVGRPEPSRGERPDDPVTWPEGVDGTLRVAPTGPHELITLGTPEGPVTLPDPRYTVSAASLRFLARSEGVTFLAGTRVGDPGMRCLVVVIPDDPGQVTCSRSDLPQEGPDVTLSAMPDGKVVGAVRLPPGYTAVRIDGVARTVRRGVVAFHAPSGPDVVVEASGPGVATTTSTVGTRPPAPGR